SIVLACCRINAWQAERSAGIARESSSLMSPNIASAGPSARAIREKFRMALSRECEALRSAAVTLAPHAAQRHTAQEHRQLGGVDLRLRFVARDGFERAGFQQSVVQPEPAAVEVQNFQPIAAAVEEQEQAAVERIGLELVANDARQAVESLAQIGRLRVDVDRHAGRHV